MQGGIFIHNIFHGIHKSAVFRNTEKLCDGDAVATEHFTKSVVVVHGEMRPCVDEKFRAVGAVEVARVSAGVEDAGARRHVEQFIAAIHALRRVCVNQIPVLKPVRLLVKKLFAVIAVDAALIYFEQHMTRSFRRALGDTVFKSGSVIYYSAYSEKIQEKEENLQ